MVVSDERELIPQDYRSVSINGAIWWFPFMVALFIEILMKTEPSWFIISYSIMRGFSISVIISIYRKYKIRHVYKK
jgi:hypothetical protein